MGEHKSAEQVHEKHLRDMGSQLGEVYHALWNEVGWVHAKWQQFRQLYAHSPACIELLNDVAGHFFGIVQDVLWEDVILHIARLTERPTTAGQANLTLVALPPLISDTALAQEVDDLVETAKSEAAFAKKWRDKRLAHRDILVALEKGAEPLPGVSRQGVERALAAIRAVMNRLEEYYWQSEVAYSHFLATGEADDLVYYLRLAKQFERKRSELLGQGKYVPEDWEEPPEV